MKTDWNILYCLSMGKKAYSELMRGLRQKRWLGILCVLLAFSLMILSCLVIQHYSTDVGVLIAGFDRVSGG
jgi:hypothetical protein